MTRRDPTRTRAAALGLLVALALLPAAPRAALAIDPVSETMLGVAIDGYDPVAYFDEGKPVEGSSDYSAEWKDAVWRFASAVHRDRFVHAPARHAPQYGGYCAWEMASGEAEDADPEVWKIADGKLYLFSSADARAKWEADVAGSVAKADASYPKLLE